MQNFILIFPKESFKHKYRFTTRMCTFISREAIADRHTDKTDAHWLEEHSPKI